MKKITIVVLCIILTGSFVLCMGAENKKKSGNKTENPDEVFTQKRWEMVSRQIESRGVRNTVVLDALRKVPRHLFVPQSQVNYAYEDRPLPIGEDQTISQPYIVALMTELLSPGKDDRVLEIGTGSGYQAAVLAELVHHVYTIEIEEVLATRSEKLLDSMGYKNITVKYGDGYAGWSEHAPFDGIIVTAAPDHIPQPLIDQLKTGGKMVIPVGDWFQELLLIEKTGDGVRKKSIIPVRFVPMTGEAEKKKR